jgi:hypothetical protein
MSRRGKVSVALALSVLGLVGGVAAAEIVQKGSLRLAVGARLHPSRLPREGSQPVAVSIGAQLTTADQSVPPPVKALRIELNKHGTVSTVGLPICQVSQIQPASSERALKACRPALVGTGSFSVDVVLGGKESYQTRGRLLVFNGHYGGRPALLGQIYSARPFANSFVIPFRIRKLNHGPYGVQMSAALPAAFTAWGHITSLNLRLARRYSYSGARHSFISAGCPAPPGVARVPFQLAHVAFLFTRGGVLGETVYSSCQARS